MPFTMPKYERKYHDEKRWEDITEIELLGDLAESHEGVYFTIRQITEFKQVLTSKAVYRLKLKK